MRPRYQTMGEVLGYTEEEMYSMDSAEMEAMSENYLADFIRATTMGTAMPDPEEYRIGEDY